ncbi:hypothetical protein V1506DRAFT_567839 [Lipomyces tetrasporus]
MDFGFVENKAYRNALEFLIRNEPEQRLDVRLSFKCFRALEDEAHKLYDSTVTIITAQSGLHAKAAEALQRGIEDGLRRELTNCGRGDLIALFAGVLDIRLNALDDQLRLYVKKPDGGLTYYKDGVETVIAVIEIGVSESYMRLKADLELWMGRFQCRKPKFRYPAPTAMSTYSANGIVRFSDAMTQARLNQPFRPYRYNGHDWFGRLDTAFIEVFRRDQAGPPQRTVCDINGEHIT